MISQMSDMPTHHPADQSDPRLAEDTDAYRTLFLVRRAEEEIARLYPTDAIKSPIHLSIGQEAVSVGVCSRLRANDVVCMSYRCHAAYLAKGGDLKAMFAELWGKATGCAGGKGGSMHLVDISAGVVGASAVVATTIPIGLGFALAFQRRNEDRIAVVFLGDGATEEGVFAESLNFAAKAKLPALFVVENNDLAIHARTEDRWATPHLCERVRTYDIPATRIDGTDLFEVRHATDDALSQIKDGRGPAFMECLTHRWREHVGPGEDFHEGYRLGDDPAEWREKDAIKTLAARLPAELREKIEAAVTEDIAEAIRFAEDSPFPTQEQLYVDVFAD